MQEQSALQTAWRNDDGSRSLELFDTPRFFKDDRTGAWEPLRPGLRLEPGRGFEADAGPFSVTLPPHLGPGNGAVLRTGGAEMVWAPAVESTAVAREAGAESVDSRRRVLASKAVEYPNVWPGVDVRYRVLTTGLKEDLVLRAPPRIDRFGFWLSGAVAVPTAQGGLRLLVEGQPVAHVPPLNALTASGTALGDPGVFVVHDPAADGRQLVEVQLHLERFAALPPAEFPVAVDPSQHLAFLDPEPYGQATRCSPAGNFNTIRVGRDPGNNLCRAYARFEYESLFDVLTAGQVAFAYLDLTATDGTSGKRVDAYDYDVHNYDTSFGSLKGDFPIASQVVFGPSGDLDVTSAVHTWFANRIPDRQFGLVGDESESGPVNIEGYGAQLIIHLREAPDATVLSSPAEGAVLAQTRPTLTAVEVGSELGTVHYNFQISSSLTASSGTVANSGWTSTPSWLVPAGLLSDGVSYYGRVFTAIDPFTYPHLVPRAPGA